MVQQRDMFTELEDAQHVDSVEVQSVVNALPASAMLKVSDVALALNRSVEYVYGLIEAGELTALTGGTKDRASYQIFRVSVIKYLKRKIK